MKSLFIRISGAINRSRIQLKEIITLHKNIPIKYKFRGILAIQIIVPLIIIGYISFIITAGIVKNKSADYMQGLISAIKYRLQDFTDNVTLISQYVLYEKQIYTILGFHNDENATDRNNAVIDINTNFKKLILSRNDLEGIYIITNDKTLYGCNIRDSSDTGVIVFYDRILQETRKSRGNLVWYYDCANKKVNHTYIARIIYEQDTFKEIGLLVIELKNEYLQSLFKELMSKEIQNFTIQTEHQEMIFSKSSSNSSENYGQNTVLLEKMTEKKGLIIDRENKMSITFDSMQDPNWLIISSVSLEKLYAEINSLRNCFIVLSSITFIILFILGSYLSQDFVNPIKKLIEAMNNTKSTSEISPVEIDRKDEFGVLGYNYNKMADRINHLVNVVYKEQITRKKAELNALQAQINPHFLFNTLNSIYWMAEMNGVSDIGKMVSSLSALISAGIWRDDKFTTIKEEFIYINHYISILKMRFGDKINLAVKMDAGLEDIQIPTLLIQPLVENSIYHGIEKRKHLQKGMIVARISALDDVVFIEIIDNGAGIEKSKLMQINGRLSNGGDISEVDSNHAKKSVGLENVNTRVKLFFGENYGVKVLSKMGHYTKIVITIPLSSNAALEYSIDKEIQAEGGTRNV